MAVVYTSQSLELAMLEALMHLDMDLIPKDAYQISLDVPEDLVQSLKEPLPRSWDRPPPYDPRVQALGDEWIKGGSSLGLRVPASVLPSRFNILLNPRHREIGLVREMERKPLPWPLRVVEFLQDLKQSTPPGKRTPRQKK